MGDFTPPEATEFAEAHVFESQASRQPDSKERETIIEGQHAPTKNFKARTNMNDEQRIKCIVELLQKSSNLKLPKGYINELSSSLGVMLKQQFKVCKDYKSKVGRKKFSL